MKKIRFLTLLAIAPIMASCSSGGVIDPEPYVDPEPVIKTDSIGLGLRDIKHYNPSETVTFTVNVKDPTIASYDSDLHCFMSYNKEGTTLATFTSAKLTYNVTVTVKDDLTAPSFVLDDNDLTIKNGTNYTINASLTYRGEDCFSESDGLNATLESTHEPSTQLEITKNKIKVTTTKLTDSGKDDVYTIYTTVMGHTLSQRLTIKVIQDTSFVVIGKNMKQNSEYGSYYGLSMYNYTSNKLNLKNDLTVTKAGTDVDYTSLTINIEDQNIATLDTNGDVNVIKEGITKITVKHGEDTKDITLIVYKPTIEEKEISLIDNKFVLNLEVTKTDTGRTYKGNTTTKKTFEIDPDTHKFTRVCAVEVNGKYTLNNESTPMELSGNNVSLCSAIFDINCAGELPITLYMEADTYLVAYDLKLLFVTGEIKTKTDFVNYIVMRCADETITGYYTLGQDVNFSGYSSGQEWVKTDNLSPSIGFQGVLDGTKTKDAQGKVTEVYKLMNINSNNYGLCLAIGQNAIIRNLDITNATMKNSEGDSLFGRFIFNARFENINVSFSTSCELESIGPEGSNPDYNGTGIISSQKVSGASFSNVTFDLSNLDQEVRCLCGKDGANSTYENVTIKCKDIKYYSTGTTYDAETKEPTQGRLFSTNPVEGITIIKN